MGEFLTIPWFGNDVPSINDCNAYGIPTVGAYKILSCGSNSAVQTPVIVAGRLSNNYCYGIAINTGFKIATSANSSMRSITLATQYGVSGVYYGRLESDMFYPSGITSTFSSLNEMLNEFINSISPEGYRNIKYSFTSGKVIGPDFVPIGANVTAYLTANPGTTITSESISVTRGGSPIEFNYSNGVLTFTAS